MSRLYYLLSHRSIQLISGIFPQCFKSALVTPIIKKRCLDHNDLHSYRSVSNLCFIAEILEKFASSQVSSAIITALFSQHVVLVITLKHLFRRLSMICSFLMTKATCLYSPYLTFPQHLTQLNILCIYWVYSIYALIPYIDHSVHSLHSDFVFTNTVLLWFSSYLTDRAQYVSLSNHCSAFAHEHSGVPLGSVLGPILFSMYVKPLSIIIDTLYHTPLIF